jgi:hypothetical protein
LIGVDLSAWTAAFHLYPLAKKHGAGFEKANIIGTWPSVEQSMAETLDIDICLT